MRFLAESTLDKLHSAPPEFWGKVLMVLLGIVAVIIAIRLIISMSKILLAALVLLLFLGICNWVYQRAEPACLTPFINKIAPYFPEAVQYSPTPAKPGIVPAGGGH